MLLLKMETHAIQESGREAEILVEIREAEKMIAAKEDEIKKAQEKKIVDFREKSKLLKDEKLAEGKSLAKQIKAKADKNIAKAVELVMKKFEELV